MNSTLLIVHVCGGILGVLSGSAALAVRKGSRLHRKAGDVFVISMMSMAASGAVLALMKSQPFNVFAGVLTFYLVATAFLAVRRNTRETRMAEAGLLLVALAAGASAWVFSWQAAHAAGSHAGHAMGYAVFGSIALLSASGDVRVLIRGGVSGAGRLVRHLWRMGFALFVAAASFFLGTSSDPVLRRTGLRAKLFPPEIRATHLPEVPVILIAILVIYWVARVLWTDRYEKLHGEATEPGAVLSIARSRAGLGAMASRSQSFSDASAFSFERGSTRPRPEDPATSSKSI